MSWTISPMILDAEGLAEWDRSKVERFLSGWSYVLAPLEEMPDELRRRVEAFFKGRAG